MRASMTLMPARSKRSVSSFSSSVVDLLLAGPEGQDLLVVVLERVVGVGAGEVADGRFALDDDVVLVVVDFEGGVEGVFDLPDDDGGDLDRVAGLVVDLDPLAVEVPGPQRDLLLGAGTGWPRRSRSS